jgi:hypothetical protein
VIVRCFVDIGELVDHDCLNFLSIAILEVLIVRKESVDNSLEIMIKKSVDGDHASIMIFQK